VALLDQFGLEALLKTRFARVKEPLTA